MVIEQKSGVLEETPEGLVKRYRDKRKSVARQIHRSMDSLQVRFKQAHAGQHLALDYLLYCPDHRRRSPGHGRHRPGTHCRCRKAGRWRADHCALLTAQPVAPERQGPRCMRFSRTSGTGPRPGRVGGAGPEPGDPRCRAGLLPGRAASTLSRSACASTARRVRQDAAGAAGAGGRGRPGAAAHYVCFNRPLADHIRRLAPPEVAGDDISHAVRSQGTGAGRGARLRAAGRVRPSRRGVRCAPSPLPDEQVDVLVVDEGQDFRSGVGGRTAALRRSGRPGVVAGRSDAESDTTGRRSRCRAG